MTDGALLVLDSSALVPDSSQTVQKAGRSLEARLLHCTMVLQPFPQTLMHLANQTWLKMLTHFIILLSMDRQATYKVECLCTSCLVILLSMDRQATYKVECLCTSCLVILLSMDRQATYKVEQGGVSLYKLPSNVIGTYHVRENFTIKIISQLRPTAKI